LKEGGKNEVKTCHEEAEDAFPEVRDESVDLRNFIIFAGRLAFAGNSTSKHEIGFGEIISSMRHVHCAQHMHCFIVFHESTPPDASKQQIKSKRDTAFFTGSPFTTPFGNLYQIDQ